MEACLYLLFLEPWVEERVDLVFYLFLEAALGELLSVDYPRRLGEVPGEFDISATQVGILGVEDDLM